MMQCRVSQKTLAVIPIGIKKSKIIERNRNYEVMESSLIVIEESCEHYGSSYKSRIRTTINAIGCKYKSPIIIDEYRRIIFFPLTSPTRGNTIWVNYNNIIKYEPSKRRNHTLIRFISGIKLEFNISYYSFNQQYLKSSKLNSAMDRILRK